MTDENRQTGKDSNQGSEQVQENRKPEGEKKKNPGVLKVIQSVLAGALGVQSSHRYREDFEGSSPFPYILGGIIFGVVFVVTLMLIVRWVLAGQ